MGIQPGTSPNPLLQYQITFDYIPLYLNTFEYIKYFRILKELFKKSVLAFKQHEISKRKGVINGAKTTSLRRDKTVRSLYKRSKSLKLSIVLSTYGMILSYSILFNLVDVI